MVRSAHVLSFGEMKVKEKIFLFLKNRPCSLLEDERKNVFMKSQEYRKAFASMCVLWHAIMFQK